MDTPPVDSPGPAPTATTHSPLRLWYRRPAREWTEALPLGNGRLGAMVFGGIERERLQLNEDTLWAGGPYAPNNPKALAALPDVRQLVFAGRYREAHDLAEASLMGEPRRQMPYETAGELRLAFSLGGGADDYERELDLDTAIARTRLIAGGVVYERRVLASAVDQVIAVHLSASRAASIAFDLSLEAPQRVSVRALGERTLILRGSNEGRWGVPGALRFEVRAEVVLSGGTCRAKADGLSIAGADEAVILIAAGTSYRGPRDVGGDPAARTERPIEVARSKSFERLVADHVAEHQRLFRRVSIDLGRRLEAEVPTDERLQDAATHDDPSLAALYFQFGRYLLISSSRPGTQPANLQGLWNDSLTPPWESKYTININTEMNYWPAENGNLAECLEPLIGMVEQLAEAGAETARVHYGAGGWVAHHNTDLWRAAAPIDGAQWGLWPTGGAWLCLVLWDHYDYSRDIDLLARIYPLMKGAADFFLQTLVTDPMRGFLVTNPSISPENWHPAGVSICAGPTMDSQILRDLFARTLEASAILGEDAAIAEPLRAALSKLAPNQIGAAGQLQEWLEDWDMQAPELDHRHVSHLYGLFPSAQITLRKTPALAAAARRSLEIRGDNATGWGLAWRINLWARLADGDRAHAILRALLGPERTYPNLFDSCPPFQIDGNFGGAAGMIEMLMQSHSQVIELLPSLPSAWLTGSLRGVRARGGFGVDIAWQDGRLDHAVLRGRPGQAGAVRYGPREARFAIPPSGALRVTVEEATLRLAAMPAGAA